MEDHYDDLGDDRSGLGDVTLYAADIVIEQSSHFLSSSSSFIEGELVGLASFQFFGVVVPKIPDRVHIANDMEEVTTLLSSLGPGTVSYTHLTLPTKRIV